MKGTDYEVIATIIRRLPKAFGQRHVVARLFADDLKQNNQRFNAAKFLEACGSSERQNDDE